MTQVLSQWINGTQLGGIQIYRYLTDDIAMSKTSDGFVNVLMAYLKVPLVL